jgi:hypothetical protein
MTMKRLMLVFALCVVVATAAFAGGKADQWKAAYSNRPVKYGAELEQALAPANVKYMIPDPDDPSDVLEVIDDAMKGQKPSTVEERAAFLAFFQNAQSLGTLTRFAALDKRDVKAILQKFAFNELYVACIRTPEEWAAFKASGFKSGTNTVAGIELFYYAARFGDFDLCDTIPAVQRGPESVAGGGAITLICSGNYQRWLLHKAKTLTPEALFDLTKAELAVYGAWSDPNAKPAIRLLKELNDLAYILKR